MRVLRVLCVLCLLHVSGVLCGCMCVACCMWCLRAVLRVVRVVRVVLRVVRVVRVVCCTCCVACCVLRVACCVLRVWVSHYLDRSKDTDRCSQSLSVFALKKKTKNNVEWISLYIYIHKILKLQLFGWCFLCWWFAPLRNLYSIFIDHRVPQDTVPLVCFLIFVSIRMAVSA
jgi:hypothetical protein